MALARPCARYQSSVRERCRFAGTSLRAAHDVPVHQNIRNGLGLDRSRVSSASFTARRISSLNPMCLKLVSSMKWAVGPRLFLSAVCGRLCRGFATQRLLLNFYRVINKRCIACPVQGGLFGARSLRGKENLWENLIVTVPGLFATRHCGIRNCAVERHPRMTVGETVSTTVS